MISRRVLVPIAVLSLVTLAQHTPASGAPAAPISGLTRVSVDQAGGDANGTSNETAISGNGRFVAFTSAASDLVPGDTNGATDVFRRDLQTGTTALVSVAGNGGPANGASSQPSISQNGRWVAFTSLASNLFGTDTNGFADVYVRDLSIGVTRRASVGTPNVQLTQGSSSPDISDDGNLVAFVLNGTSEKVGVRNRHAHNTAFYSSGPAGCPEGGSSRTDRDPTLGANGRYLAFAVTCVRLPLVTVRVIERDRSLGTWTEIAHESSEDPSHAPQFIGTRYSADANALAWARSFIGHGGNTFQLFVRERTPRYLTPDFSQTSVEPERPDLSADGRYLAYVGGHGDAPFGNPLLPDAVHVIDLANNSIVEASAPPGRAQRVAGNAHNPAIDDGGNVVAFTTNEGLIAGDHNHNVLDVYATVRAAAPPTVVPTIIVNTSSVLEPDTPQLAVAFNFAVAAHYSGADVPITWHTIDGTAQAPADYLAVTNGTASVPQNVFAGTADLSVTVQGDNAPEPNETFRIRITAPAGFRVLYNTGDITILNDD